MSLIHSVQCPSSPLLVACLGQGFCPSKAELCVLKSQISDGCYRLHGLGEILGCAVGHSQNGTSMRVVRCTRENPRKELDCFRGLAGKKRRKSQIPLQSWYARIEVRSLTIMFESLIVFSL